MTRDPKRLDIRRGRTVAKANGAKVFVRKQRGMKYGTSSLEAVVK